MAIDSTGKPTTTGIMNTKPNIPKAPNLSALGKGQPAPKQKPMPAPKTQTEPEGTPMELEFAERAKSLTDEDQAALQTVLSPSVKAALGKIIPEFKPVMDAYGLNEPNVVIPASLMSSYASKIYGIQNQNEALAKFYDDVTSDIDQQMEQEQQPNVPPSQPTQAKGLMTSPQNMETV
jgi:hypothetical protein|tara:strand:+ start:52 stop:582 length:531 start_codon:yes stop_codon:yes gene_type:complete